MVPVPGYPGSAVLTVDPVVYLFWAVNLAALIVKVWAIIDAVFRPSEAYRAADKRSKTFWVILLGVMIVLTWFFGNAVISIIGIISVTAAIVYLVDVRPAVKEVARYPRGGGPSSYGPYGPW
jgi:purine-cytosine permease-like protein